MLKYEWKKIFSKTKNKIAILLMMMVWIITSLLTINKVEYVNENGRQTTGITAAAKLRGEKNKWAGFLTDDVLKKVIEKNDRINHSKQAMSKEIEEQNKAYAKKQGISGICDVISSAFSPYRDYDYFAVDSVSKEEVTTIYDRRISELKQWLDSGKESYTSKEKEFMIKQYKELSTPFYYEYTDGWSVLLQDISTFILIVALVIGFLVSGIFSEEFQTKADSIFFSTKRGRNKAVMAKVGTGFLMITICYVIFLMLYTCTVLTIVGADGAGCPIQLEMWRSVYNITFFQAYIFIAVGGYIGTLFASVLAMLASALCRSSVIAVIVPFIILCAFPFLSRIITLPRICSLFPDQLLEIYIDLKDAALINVGGKIMTAPMVIIPVYGVISLLMQPLLYQIYKRMQIN